MKLIPSPYPKVLIFGETFNRRDGGGITLSNLFADWPEDRIANAVDGNRIATIAADAPCTNFYSLGEREKKTVWPFGFLRRKFPSGPVAVKKDRDEPVEAVFAQKNTTKKMSLAVMFYKVLHVTGLYHRLFKLKLTEDFLGWVSAFGPDYIYVQFNTIDMIRFVIEFTEHTKIPVVIHMMDDWPETIVKRGLFSGYWKRKFHQLLTRAFRGAYKRLAISDAMSEEYQRRYGCDFITFHNPIDINFWGAYRKTDYTLPAQASLLYAGRIGTGVNNSLLDVGKMVSQLRAEGREITLDIYCDITDSAIMKPYTSLPGVNLKGKVAHRLLPRVWSAADILVLPYDFDPEGLAFIKYSMPTKASEYMITGVPILLFASVDTAVYRHARAHRWAYAVGENNAASLREAIVALLDSKSLRSELGIRGYTYAINNYEASVIKSRFLHVFS